MPKDVRNYDVREVHKGNTIATSTLQVIKLAHGSFSQDLQLGR